MKITALLVLKCIPEGSDPVILANASDVSHFGYFQRSGVREFVVFVGRTVAKRTPPGQRQSVQHEEYKVHSYNRNGLCALGFMDDHYPVRSSFSLLNQVLDEYQKNFGDSWRTVQADKTEPWPYLNEALTKFQDPAEADKLFKIQRELDETKIILHKTIDSVLARGEKLDSLVEKRRPHIQFLLPSFTEPKMAVQLNGLWLPNPSMSGTLRQPRTSSLSTATVLAAASPLSSPSTIQIVGGKIPSLYGTANTNSSDSLEVHKTENFWLDLDADLYYWTKTLRPVQWYPGHIAKTEKELKEQLRLMDVVIEVRDARIPMSTTHPQMDLWLGNRKRILVLNREDMISTEDRNAWATYFARQGTKVVFSNGQLGMGTMKLGRLAKALAAGVNVKRRAKGLLPRPVRAGIVGYPNVGKSSLINRLLKRRMCLAAPRPGVTRELKWVRFGKDLELLDSPGILPMRISDQSAAIKLAICDDIGERSYDVTDVAAILVQMLSRLPSVGTKAMYNRYKINMDGHCGKIFVQKLAAQLFNGDIHQAAFRVLTDFRKGKFGWIALERPPR